MSSNTVAGSDLNLIDIIIKYLRNKFSNHIDPNWAEDIATMTVSLFSYNSVAMTKLGSIRPNLAYLYLAESGFFKSLPIKHFLRPFLSFIKREYSLDLWAPSSFSMEGLVEYFRNKELKVGIMIRDECSTLFKDSMKKYGADILEFMTELYDGATKKRYTRTFKLEEIDDVYFCFLGMSTEYLLSLINEDYLEQGFFNRLLYDIRENEPAPWDPEEFDFPIEDREKEQEFYRDIAEKLLALEKYRYGIINDPKYISAIATGCHKAAAKFLKRKERKYRYFASYVTRVHEHTIKLAMIRALGRIAIRPHSKTETDTFPILRSDLEWAYNKMRRHLRMFQKFIERWEFRKLYKRYEQEETEAKHILKIIKEHGGKISRSELYKHTAIRNRRKLDEVITYLLDAGYIEAIIEPTGGRNRIVYQLKEAIV